MKIFNKFLVLRRDNTVPEWPWLVMGAADPAAPHALRAYADEARRLGMDVEYCEQIRLLAQRFDDWRKANHTGDPDADRHRTDDPDVVRRIPVYSTALPPQD
jgi:hypothetical protein